VGQAGSCLPFQPSPKTADPTAPKDRSGYSVRDLQRSGGRAAACTLLVGSGKLPKIFLPSATFVLYKSGPEELIYPVNRQILLAVVISGLILPSAAADLFPSSGPVASSKSARLRWGKAAAPKAAPVSVKRAIWAANQLQSKPYRYGGGHKSFKDHAYDCSGTVSYVLAAAGLLSSPMSSTEFRSYGERGPGKWITIYAREGHTFAVIAGLRLDTTPFDRYTGKWAPRWYPAYRPPYGFDARHPIGL